MSGRFLSFARGETSPSIPHFPHRPFFSSSSAHSREIQWWINSSPSGEYAGQERELDELQTTTWRAAVLETRMRPFSVRSGRGDGGDRRGCARLYGQDADVNRPERRPSGDGGCGPATVIRRPPRRGWARHRRHDASLLCGWTCRGYWRIWCRGHGRT